MSRWCIIASDSLKVRLSHHKKEDKQSFIRKNVVPLRPMASHKNGWWLIIGCSFRQFIAEQRIENGLLSELGYAACQSKNPENPQSHKLPLYKGILRFLTKLRKNERNTKGKFAFLFISECKVSSAKPKIRKICQKTVTLPLFFTSFRSLLRLKGVVCSDQRRGLPGLKVELVRGCGCQAKNSGNPHKQRGNQKN